MCNKWNYKLWDFQRTLKSYEKNLLSHLHPYYLHVYLHEFMLLMTRPKVTSTAIHGHARVPWSPCVEIKISMLIGKIFNTRKTIGKNNPYEPSHAKKALRVKIFKIDLLTNYDKIQFKFTEYEIWDRYEACFNVKRWRTMTLKKTTLKMTLKDA